MDSTGNPARDDLRQRPDVDLVIQLAPMARDGIALCDRGIGENMKTQLTQDLHRYAEKTLRYCKDLETDTFGIVTISKEGLATLQLYVAINQAILMKAVASMMEST
jgi:hypothetical protein